MSIIGKPLPTADQVRGRPFPGHTLRSFSRRLTLQQGGRLILGADLNRSELGWGRSALNVACGLENQDYHGAVEIFRPKTARRARSGSGPVLRRWRPDVAAATSAACAAPARAMIFSRLPSCRNRSRFRTPDPHRPGNPRLREDQMTSLRTWCGAVTAATLLILNSAAIAQDWPNRSMLAVSAVSAGNAGDIVARIVLEQVSKQIGQSFVIENRPGGGGTIGSASVAKAEADGYTMLLLTSSQGSYVVLHRTLPYDPLRDLVPVALFGIQPSVLVAAPSKGWTSVADLVAAAKARPGALNFASAGIGSASHWAAERLRLATGSDD